MLAERFRRWFEYEIDAHAKTLGSIESVPEQGRGSVEFQKALAVFGHLVAARRIWLFRLGIAKTPPAALFPEKVTLSELKAQWNDAAEQWKTYLAKVTDEELVKPFEYQSLDAGRFRNTVEEVLTQLFGHSSYHRGQIAMLVKTAGGAPAITDFIFWAREAI